MTSIPTRAQQAKPEEVRGLLLELALLVHADKPLFHLSGDAFPDFWPWTGRFRARLDCGAYLDAAMMLVPEETAFAVGVNGHEPEHIWAWVDSSLLNLHHAATPALALIAAIAQAIEVGQ